MKKILAAAIVMMALFLTMLSSAVCAGQSGTEIDEHRQPFILAQVKILKSTLADNERVRLARNLSESVSAMSVDARESISDAELHALADLLRNPNDGVRMYAAVALGKIGPRAINYVPDLTAALKRGEFPPSGQIGSQLGSVSAIYKAIEKITKK